VAHFTKQSSTACATPNSAARSLMPITLRDVLADDEPFLFEVYASTRAQEMAMVSWDEEQRKAFLTMQFSAQHSYYQSQFPEANFSLILRDDLPVGRLYVLRQAHDLRILDLTLLPEYRNAGIGTPLIRDLLNEAAESCRNVHIYVESFNPSLRLFERLGFKNIAEEGHNLLLEWRPNSKSA
jgi:ribosomal protein S18 acetylase RimI-like enzyme